MHSFHQSRGRIAFEVLCALTVSASCAAAWDQTGATAFLPAALATALYGLWHLTDMRATQVVPVSVMAVEPFEPVGAVPVAVEESAVVSKPKKRNRKKQPIEEVPIGPAEAAVPGPPAPFPERAEIEEELHAPVAPLFEPKSFVRQSRPIFGRKAGQVQL